MKYLIDTHVLLWLATDNPALSKKVKRIFLNEENEIYLSFASIWEMAIKMSLNKLTLKLPLKKFIEEHIVGNGIKLLEIKVNHLLEIEKLPFHHHDPFDRLIISQSIAESIPIITSDTNFDDYDIKVIW
jgi:PIN domain nuclease of toxin-antitoxin system